MLLISASLTWAGTVPPPPIAQEAVLIHRNLDRSHLAGANLRGIFAARSSWAWSNLEGADLRAAKLFEANFSNASLKGASLAGADLSFANFEKADLRGADLSQAFFFATRLNGALVDSRTRLPWPRDEVLRRGLRWIDENN